MSADAWLTLAAVTVMVALLVWDLVPPVATVLGATIALLLLDVVEAEAAFSGFSNPAPITVAALYVVAGAVQATGAFEWMTRRLLPAPGPSQDGASVRPRELARFLPAPLASSAFLNNTAIVAMIAPRVTTWGRQSGRAPSGFLMPLSFAAILGGLVTAIGTSTNLVVSGLLREAGYDEIGLFEISKVGIPVAIVGLAVLILTVPRLLPVRGLSRRSPAEGTREFTVEMEVATRSALIGSTVSEAGLRNLQGVYLVEIERSHHTIAPVSPHEVVVAGDRLTFAGNVEQVLDLHRIPGLVPAEERHFAVMSGGPGRTFYEMVVSPRSSLVGRTLKEVGFRNRYGAAVVAIHRAGERLGGKLGSVALRAGDVLLALSDERLRDRLFDHHDFLVVSRLDGDTPPRRHSARLVEAIIGGLLVFVGLGFVDILDGALLAALVLVASRTISVAEARSAVDLDVVVLIAASFGVGAAVAESGLAATVAERLVTAFDGFGDVGLLAGVLLTTVVLTELVTNNAAAVLVFPIGLAVAAQAGLDPRPFAMVIALGASLSFLTPIGYQTNTMVYGMGGYRFGDFARVGLPLAIVTVGVALALTPVMFPF